MNTKQVEQSFFDLAKQDTNEAIALITRLFVGLTIECVKRNGEDISKPITISGIVDRDITIHPPK